MTHRLSEISTQEASTLACDYLICQSCAYIDRERDRMRKGHVCGICGNVSEVGEKPFPLNVSALIDLTQEVYHAKAALTSLYAPSGADVATVLFYCALREALLNAFLVNHLRAQSVPEALVRKLLDDNKLANQRFGELFASVTTMSWGSAVDAAAAHAGVDFRPVSAQMRSAAALRNEFLHEGRPWQATREFATQCLDSIPELVALFAALHNVYTHPLQKPAT